jgi:uncharacterized protein
MALSPVTTTFAQEPLGAAFGINAYGPGYLEVNGVRHTAPLILHPETGPEPQPDLEFGHLNAQWLGLLKPRAPEIILIGTGEKQRFLPASALAPLMSARIGVECMTLGAACRTFNVLVSEGRKTIAVFLFD